MADKNQIIATSSNLKAIVEKFNDQLTNYIEEMESSINTINDRISELGRYWEDEGAYMNFKSQIQRQLQLMSEQNHKGEELSSYLKNKAERFQQLIAKLEGLN